MLSDRPSKSFYLRQRAFLIDFHHAARAHDVRRQNSHRSPLCVLAAQDAVALIGSVN
jgi:hypothetical protein